MRDDGSLPSDLGDDAEGGDDSGQARSDRAQRVAAAVANYLLRRAAGESIAVESIVESHPDLAPELAEELRRARRIAAAMEHASLSDVVLAETRQRHDSNTGGARLEVRCPSCHTPLEVAVDTPLTDLTCDSCGSHFSLVDQDEATRMAPSLTKLGRFELIERLGVGGFGTVWKARDKQLDRTVAVKIPRQESMTGEDQDRFFREARTAAQLRHPGIVSVHEVGRDGDSVFIVSEFVRGVTLRDWLTGQQLSCREAAELCAKIADALDHAHEQGVVHRDLKPANIMLDGDGEPHLMDFGLARRSAGEITITADGQIVGTPAYMSPEQAAGESHTADRRSDVYSLGVILFQLLTSERPFRGNERMLMHQVIHDEPPSPRQLNGHVPKDLETVTLKCLEKDPNRRYPSTAEVAEELRRFMAGHAILARPLGRLQRGVRWVKRNRMVSALATFAALALVGGTAASLLFAIDANRQAAIAVAKEREASMAKQQAAASKAKGDILDEMIQGAEQEVAQKAKIYGPDSRMTTSAMSSLADFYRTAHRLDAAIATQEDALARMEKQKNDGLSPALQMNRLVDDYLQAGREADAIRLTDRFAASAREKLGSRDAFWSMELRMIADAYIKLNRPDEAVNLTNDTFEALLKTLGPDDKQTKVAQSLMRMFTTRAQQPFDAVAISERIFAARRAKMGSDNQAISQAASELADAYLKADRRDDAVKLMAEHGLFVKSALLQTKEGPAAVKTLLESATSWPNDKKLRTSDSLMLGELRLVAGDAPSAEVAIRQAIQTGPVEHYFYKTLGWCLLRQGKKDEARKAFREALKEFQEPTGAFDLGSQADPDHLTAGYYLDLLPENEYVEKLAGDKTLAGFPWFYVGQHREIEGEKEEAIAAYRRCIELGTDSTPHKAFAQWRLRKLEPVAPSP